MLTFCFLLVAIYLKVYIRSRRTFSEAERRLHRGQIKQAIARYSDAIRWYTPGNRYVSVAIMRLENLGAHAYQSGKLEQAQLVYESLYSALSSIRGPYQPHRKHREACQKHLSHLLALLPSEVGAFQDKGAHNLHRRMLRLLQQHPPAPAGSPGWLLSLCFCFCLSVTCISIIHWSRGARNLRWLFVGAALLSLVMWIGLQL